MLSESNSRDVYMDISYGDKFRKALKRIYCDRSLYIILLPAMLYFVVFSLWPIYGMKMAFEDYRVVGKSVWVGLKHINELLGSPAFYNVLKNTLIISAMKIILYFPIPVIFALLLNEITNSTFKNFTQAVSYLPHFLSYVVIAGIWISLLSPQTGAVNQILGLFNISPIDFMTSKSHFRWVLFFSETWRSTGWDSIIYVAAILNINNEIYEAADVDGANRLQVIRHIIIPELKMPMITLFILNLGFFLNAGFDQVFNFMNDSVISVGDILDTYVYRMGLLNGQYSYATAASLFKGVIGVVLILISHFVSKKISGKGVW